MEQIIIDESNFDQYFFDVRHHAPKVGQVLAKYKAVARFCDGQQKHDVIQLLKEDKAREAALVMRKIHFAREPDCYRVCREICEDLASGMSDQEVAAKEYDYILEAFYYTQRECVPKGDPHWETIQLLEFDPQSGGFNVTVEIGESDEDVPRSP